MEVLLNYKKRKLPQTQSKESTEFNSQVFPPKTHTMLLLKKLGYVNVTLLVTLQTKKESGSRHTFYFNLLFLSSLFRPIVRLTRGV